MTIATKPRPTPADVTPAAPPRFESFADAANALFAVRQLRAKVESVESDHRAQCQAVMGEGIPPDEKPPVFDSEAAAYGSGATGHVVRDDGRRGSLCPEYPTDPHYQRLQLQAALDAGRRQLRLLAVLYAERFTAPQGQGEGREVYLVTTDEDEVPTAVLVGVSADLADAVRRFIREKDGRSEVSRVELRGDLQASPYSAAPRMMDELTALCERHGEFYLLDRPAAQPQRPGRVRVEKAAPGPDDSDKGGIAIDQGDD
jgi:hypothetical protein